LPVHKSLIEKGATSQEHLTFAAKLEIGVLREEAGGKRKKEGARRSVFTNMICSRMTTLLKP
jgi:hypothetical protein